MPDWSTDVIVMSGPTLPPDCLPAGVTHHPPATAGDFWRLAQGTPCSVVLIDGQFETMPSPWHAEMVHAMARGFRLIGAASLGALRAAELDSCGMIGVGAVYRAFATGRLVADDEVAVQHAPAALGYRPLTEAMVDIRATIAAARRRREIDFTTARRLIDAALQLNFRDRTWLRILASAGAGKLKLPPVALKRADAAAAIALAQACASQPAPLQPPGPKTAYLDRLARFIAAADAQRPSVHLRA